MPQFPAKARDFLKRHILRKPKRRTEATTPHIGGLPPGSVQGTVRSATANAVEQGVQSTALNATPATEVVYFNASDAPPARHEVAQTVNQALQNNAYSGELRSHVPPDVRIAEAETIRPAVPVINYQNLEENPIRVHTVNPSALPHPGDSGQAHASNVSPVYADFLALKQQVDKRLAHLRTFRSIGELDTLFDSAVKEAVKDNDDQTSNAIIKLKELEGKLSVFDDDDKKAEEAEWRLNRLKATLDSETPLEHTGGFRLLAEEKARSFRERYDAIENEVSTNGGAPLEEIKALQKDLDAELTRRRHMFSSQMVEMDVLKPLLDRAISIAGLEGDTKAKDDLIAAWSEIEGKNKGNKLNAATRSRKLKELQILVTKTIKKRSEANMLDDQKKRLPVKPEQLSVGKVLGKGHFGGVVELVGSGNPPLVGKWANQEGEIEREAAVYAQLGEHPNIAKCYGIHAIGAKDTLVMENVQGGDITEVLEGLRLRYRDVAHEREVVDPKDPVRKRRIVVPVRKDPISRAEYLGSVQQIMKGILQGLAHFQSLGMVHKDVKGDNIRFDPRTLQPKLVDMGLAQQEGPQKVPECVFRIAPPELFVTQSNDDPPVTPVWDSFSVSKVLFPLLEQATPHEATPEPAEIYQFLTGNPKPEKAHLNKGLYITPTKSNNDVAMLSASAWEENPDTKQLTVRKKPDGEPVWQALNPTPAPGTAAPGFYGVMTNYVAFMHGLTHPDPAQRLSPIEALKHPFMTERLIEESQLAKILKRPHDALPQEAEPAPTAYADPLTPNPTLYFRLNSQNGFNYRVDSRDPGPPWARVEQFCAYLAAEWISTGCPAQGLRFDGLSGRHDAVTTVTQWAGTGGLGAQVSFAAQRIGGQKTASATALENARLARYGPGTVLWFGTDAHVTAAAVQADGTYLVYDPDTGQTETLTSAAFATNRFGANVFVVRVAASAASRESAPDSPPAAPAPSPQQQRAMASIEFAIDTMRVAYDKDANLLSDDAIVQLQETGKARGSTLQRVIDTMRRVQQLHAELRTAPAKYAAFNGVLQELRSQAENYLLEHHRPVSSDGKARKKACEAIGNCVAALEQSFKTARDQVEIVTYLVGELPLEQRGNQLLDAYDDLLAQPYTPADIREDRASLS